MNKVMQTSVWPQHRGPCAHVLCNDAADADLMMTTTERPEAVLDPGSHTYPLTARSLLCLLN